MSFRLSKTIKLPYGCEASISADGRFVVTRQRYSHYADEQDSVNIFDNLGNKINSLNCYSNGERGTAFWPDNNYILAPGCAEKYPWDEDGLKLYSIPDRKYNGLMFANTPVTGINTTLLGVSPTGRFILCSSRMNYGIYCIDSFDNNRSIKVDREFDKHLFFNDEYLILVKNILAKTEVFALPNLELCDELPGKIALCSYNRKKELIILDHSGGVSFALQPTYDRKGELKILGWRNIVRLKFFNLSEHVKVDKEINLDIPNPITSGTISSDEELLAIADSSYSIYVLDTKNYEIMDVINNAHENELLTLKFTHKNRLVTISEEIVSFWEF